jgi:hypothetical protein
MQAPQSRDEDEAAETLLVSVTNSRIGVTL